MSSLFQQKQQQMIHIGSMNINELHSYHKNLSDEKEIERCPEAAFLNNDKKQISKVISQSLNDIIKAKRKVKK